MRKNYKHDVQISNNDVIVIITYHDGSRHSLLLDLDQWNIVKDKSINLTYSICSSGIKTYYARIHTNNGREYLHRFLCQAKNGDYVDHKDSNTLNNKRLNLRLCSQSDNMQNRLGAQSNSSTKALGVYYIKARGKYGARVTINKINYNLGQFFSKEEAIKVVTSFREKYVPFSKNAEGANEI